MGKSEVEIASVLQEYFSSGLPLATFAREKGIPESDLRGWLGRLQESVQRADPVGNLKLDGLPTRAVVSLASRCARRAQTLLLSRLRLTKEHQRTLNDAVDLIGGVAAGTKEWTTQARTCAEEFERLKKNAPQGGVVDYWVSHSVVSSAALAAQYASEGDAAATNRHALDTVRKLGGACMLFERAENFASAYADPILFENAALRVTKWVWADYLALTEAQERETWSSRIVVPKSFFALNTQFDVKSEFERGPFTEIISEVSAKTLQHFRHYPERILSLSPEQFEELVGTIMSEFGFDVELTKKTRDGGVDIVCVSNVPTKIQLLVECKRYVKTKSVGIAAVQRLHGVTQSRGATKGLLVTTAPRFSGPAQEFLDKHKWIVGGQTFDGLISWLEHRERRQMESRCWMQHDPP